MQQVDIDYLDGEFTIQEQEPSTLAELQELLGAEAAVVDEVTSNLRYRNKYPRVYREVSKLVVERHGFPRAVVDTKKLKDGTVKDVLESENDHLRAFWKGRADAEGKIETPAPAENREALASLFAEVANGSQSALYIEGERRAGGGKVSAAATEMANKIHANGVEKVEEAARRIEETVSGYKVGRDAEGAVTVESLARGIQALQKDAEAKAKRAATASLGI